MIVFWGVVIWAIIRAGDSSGVVRSVDQMDASRIVEVRFARGEIDAAVLAATLAGAMTLAEILAASSSPNEDNSMSSWPSDTDQLLGHHRHSVVLLRFTTMGEEQIHLLDDEPDLRRMVRQYPEAEGFIVLAAANRTSAFEGFGASSAGLVLLDVGMPSPDGLEVLRQLRRTSDVPVIMLTARSEEIDRMVDVHIANLRKKIGDDAATRGSSQPLVGSATSFVASRVLLPLE